MTKKPAHRGATAGLSKCVRQDRFGRYAPTEVPRQAPYIATRFGLTPLHAALISELAFPIIDNWRGRS